MSRRCAAACASAAEIPFYENLGLVIEGQSSVLLQNLLDVREHL